MKFKYRQARAVLVAGLLLGPGSGCANLFLSGGSVTSTDFARDSLTSYRIAKCIDLTNDSVVEKPNATLHLVRQEGRILLFERSSDGTGTLFKNRWTASDGDHYFAWIGAADAGFEYIIPPDGQKGAKRLTYVSLQSVDPGDGTRRPTSTPGSTCELVPMANPLAIATSR